MICKIKMQCKWRNENNLEHDKCLDAAHARYLEHWHFADRTFGMEMEPSVEDVVAKMCREF